MDEAKKTLWTKVVADFELSGKTQRAFSTERQIELSRLRYWIYALRNASRPLSTEEEGSSVKAPEDQGPEKAMRMVPVRVVASTAPKAREAKDVELLELALPSGARLRFPAGTDLRYLQQLTAVL
jgi:hypothetical protein